MHDYTVSNKVGKQAQVSAHMKKSQNFCQLHLKNIKYFEWKSFKNELQTSFAFFSTYRTQLYIFILIYSPSYEY